MREKREMVGMQEEMKFNNTMVTPKGVDFIAKLLLEDGYEYRKR